MLDNRKSNSLYMSRAEKRLQNLPDFRFTWTDMICVTFSIVTYLADISTGLYFFQS